MSHERVTGADAPRIADVSRLKFVEAAGVKVAELGIAGCHARVVDYAAGTEIPLHRHTRPSVKLLIRGAIALESVDGPLGELKEGMFYWCGTGLYRGRVLKDSYLLVIDEEGSERIEADASELDAALLRDATGRTAP
jgi:hypothetical protein